jgi:hypothetical protein
MFGALVFGMVGVLHFRRWPRKPYLPTGTR